MRCNAQHGAAQVFATYDRTPPVANIDPVVGEAYGPDTLGPNGEPASTRGDLDAGLAAARVRVAQTYTTPVENHNPSS